MFDVLFLLGFIGIIYLVGKVDKIMATVQEIQDALATIAAGVDALEAAIADLKAKVAAGGVATQADLDALGAKAAAIVADLADASDQG